MFFKYNSQAQANSTFLVNSLHSKVFDISANLQSVSKVVAEGRHVADLTVAIFHN